MSDINPLTKRTVKVEGRIYVTTGTTGTRKTTLIKEKLSQIPLPKYIFDIDHEFHMFNNHYKKVKRSAEKPLEDLIGEFKSFVVDKWESVLVFSEAGILFAHHGMNDMEVREILKSARRRGNFLFFDFHALSEVPIELLRYVNYLYMKKETLQTPAQIKKFWSYPLIKQYMLELMDSDIEHETRLVIPRDLKIDMEA